MTADLHAHTNASDGNLTRRQLLEHASKLGLDLVAVTDHDTMYNSYTEPDDPVRVLTGCELSAIDTETDRHVHLLCYLPKDTTRLSRYFAHMRAERNRAAAQMIEKVKRVCPVVTLDSTEPFRTPEGILFKQGIMSVLVRYGYADTATGALYQEMLSSRRGSCNVPLAYGEASEVARMAGESGGIVVLAHPSVYGNMPVARRFCAEGLLDGIEVEHPRNTDEDKEELRDLCEKYHLLQTGGSDYHGANNSLGMVLGKYVTPEETLSALFALSDRKAPVSEG